VTGIRFRAGIDAIEEDAGLNKKRRKGADRIDFSGLPMEEREHLCRSLLAEFGVTRVQTSGAELVHSCCLPDHDDSSPSASLNFEKLAFNCFSCGGSGGIIWLIATCRGEDAHEARQWLQREAGLDGVQDLAAMLRFIDALYEDHPESIPIPRMHESVLAPWMFIHPYLTEIRKVPESTIEEFKVGWDPETNRIVIPHFWQGDLVGWQTRRIVNDKTPKYKNSPDFPKRSTIYHYGLAGLPVVVESPMSVLSKHHVTRDYRLEATFGMEIPDTQVRLLAKHPRLVLWFDNDDAGFRATHRVAEALTDYTKVWVVENPWDADPADICDTEYRRLVEAAVPYPAWMPNTHPEPLHGEVMAC
jgi:DNA primase